MQPLRFILISGSILLAMGCKESKTKETLFLSIITPWIQDTAEFNRQLERNKITGRKFEIVKVDTAFIKKNISYWIISNLEQLDCIQEIQDESNNDSSILIVEIKENLTMNDALKAITRITDNEKNFPMNMAKPLVIPGKFRKIR